MNDENIVTVPFDNPNPHRRRMFEVRFFGDCIIATVTSTPAEARTWLYRILHIHRFIRHKLIIGLGVQWRSSSRQPATLQLCIGHQCLIFQLLHAPSVPRVMRRFLRNPRYTFVGVWNYNDESMLLSSKHRLVVSRIIDLREVAAEKVGLSRQLSMGRLADILLGYEDVKKPIRVGRSDWDDDWLSDEQIQYACVDAFISFSLGKKLRAWEG